MGRDEMKWGEKENLKLPERENLLSLKLKRVFFAVCVFSFHFLDYRPFSSPVYRGGREGFMQNHRLASSSLSLILLRRLPSFLSSFLLQPHAAKPEQRGQNKHKQTVSVAK
jgi:hypothetical protein